MIMANTSSAKKAILVARRRRIENQLGRSGIETQKSILLDAVAQKDQKKASEALGAVYKALDKAAKTRVISKNKASREKAKFSWLVKNLK